MNDQRHLLVCCLLVALLGAACANKGNRVAAEPSPYLSGQNYAYAVYGRGARLLHSPIEPLRRTLERQPSGTGGSGRADGITDVFVISHGWNFTLAESARLYENYVLSAQQVVDHIQTQPGEAFQPYFIFIAWNSVTRPLRGALESISPFNLGYFLDLAGLIDTAAFHIPSAWGETQNAFEMAMGDPGRRRYDPASYGRGPGESDYHAAVKAAVESAANEPFNGYDVPVSVLLDELMRMRRGDGTGSPRFRLHTIGHSYGAKIISLASLDAVSRVHLALHDDDSKPDPVILDSMMLINPAMRLGEMFQPVEIPIEDGSWGLLKTARPGEPVRWSDDKRSYQAPDGLLVKAGRAIDKKAVIYSRQDSATGWLFAVSQMLVDNESVSSVRGAQSAAWQGDRKVLAFWETLLLPLRFGQVLVITAFKDVRALLVEPPLATWNLGKSSGFGNFLERFIGIPFSPISSHRAIGNTGFAEVHGASHGFFSLQDAASDAYLKESVGHGESAFECATEELGRRVPAETGLYNLYDANSVYIGFATGRWNKPVLKDAINFVAVPGAHGDIRSYDLVEKVPKRMRSFNFIYNFTRSDQAAMKDDCQE